MLLFRPDSIIEDENETSKFLSLALKKGADADL